MVGMKLEFGYFARKDQWLYVSEVFNSGDLAREVRSGAPWVRKCSKLPIRENLVIT